MLDCAHGRLCQQIYMPVPISFFVYSLPLFHTPLKLHSSWRLFSGNLTWGDLSSHKTQEGTVVSVYGLPVFQEKEPMSTSGGLRLHIFAHTRASFLLKLIDGVV